MEFFGVSCESIYYHYTAVPFGSKLAPAVASLISEELTIMIKEVLKIESIAYLDDILLISNGPHRAVEEKELTLELLQNMNFEINFDKVEGPSKDIEFLGFKILSGYPLTLTIESTKLQTVRQKVIQALDSRKLNYSQIASLAGSLLFVSEVDILGWANTLPLWNCTKGLNTENRNKKIKLSEISRNHLKWWKERLDVRNINYPPTISTMAPLTEHDILNARRLFTDASGTKGFGFHTDDYYIQEHHDWNNDMFSGNDMLEKELYPLVYFLENYGFYYEHEIIIWLCDNAAAVLTTNGGAARNVESNQLIIRYLLASSKHNIQVLAIWIPREYNELADYLSKYNVYY